MVQVQTSPTPAPTAKAKGGRFIGSFGVQVLAAMIVGLGLGLLARSLGPAEGQPGYGLAETLHQVGAIFVQLLRVLVPPLVFTAIVASIANLRELQNAARLVWRTLLWFAITALIAVAIGIALGLVPAVRVITRWSTWPPPTPRARPARGWTS